MLNQQADLQIDTYEALFDQVRATLVYEYDHARHIVTIKNGTHDIIAYIRLPLHLQLDKELNIIDDACMVVYLSIESDNAAICLQEGEENIYHTTFSAYMTRKKQGYSQIKHLNKKGKSRAGSRVRLASTLQFFENINTVMTELLEEYMMDRIGLSCSTTLIPFLYQSKVNCPFEKKDPRLYRIPLHIPKSNHTNLIETIGKLKRPVLFYDDVHKQGLHDLLQLS